MKIFDICVATVFAYCNCYNTFFNEIQCTRQVLPPDTERINTAELRKSANSSNISELHKMIGESKSQF